MLRKNNLEKTLLQMGKHSYQTEDGWTIVEADHPMHFHIDDKSRLLRYSVPKDTGDCKVARALRRAIGAPGLDFVVGAGLTKILYGAGKIEVQFATPRILAVALKRFDKTNGDWDLPPNLYKLLPLPKSWRIKALRDYRRSKKSVVVNVSVNSKKRKVVSGKAGKTKTQIERESKTIVRKTRDKVTRVIVRRSRFKKLSSRIS